MKVEIKRLRSERQMCVLDGLEPTSTIAKVKELLHNQRPRLYPTRQMFKTSTERKARGVTDESTLEGLGIKDGGVLYFKDLGMQISWTTVFLCEYAGPLFMYLIFYFRPSLVYGVDDTPIAQVVHIAMACWMFHYVKRLLETVFIHRFSHATMPLRNLFKNCTYYWGSAAFVSYFVNHPLYTPAWFGNAQVYGGLLLFVVCECGNFAIHVALRDLRPPGTKERRVPMATGNPLTFLFNFVSCPNYTYEIGAWLGFSIMTQCVPALLFTLAGFAQMAQWAQGKHRNYRREFEKYPRRRRAIVPFLL